jgi:hypothetical protein
LEHQKYLFFAILVFKGRRPCQKPAQVNVELEHLLRLLSVELLLHDLFECAADDRQWFVIKAFPQEVCVFGQFVTLLELTLELQLHLVQVQVVGREYVFVRFHCVVGHRVINREYMSPLCCNQVPEHSAVVHEWLLLVLLQVWAFED